MSHENLEEFNKENILVNLLAVEEHIVANNNIPINTWCARKHFLLGSGHHAFELQQLLSSKNPQKSHEIGKFREKWRKLMESNPTAAQVRDLRNEFREIINDPTLTQKKESCGVCALDKRNADTTGDTETSINIEETRTENSNSGAGIVIGMLAVAAVILLIAGKHGRK